jgi:uncharacterized protein (TIGR04141 family)
MPRVSEVTAQLKLNKLRYVVDEDKGNTDDYLQSIIDSYNSRLEMKSKLVKSYKPAEIKDSVFAGVNLALYYSKFNSRMDLLPKLLLEISDDMSEFLDIRKDNFNYVLFIWNENGIFAITGGTGYAVIDKYTDREFGYKFLTFIGKDKYNVVSSSEKSIVGKIFANDRVFREEYDYSSENHFGVSIDSLDVVTNADFLKSIFNIPVSKNRDTIACAVDNGLSLKKRVTLSKIIDIVKILLSMDLEKNEFAFLKVISGAAKNRPLITELSHALWSKLYDYCLDDSDQNFEFDIMGPKTSEFITASEFIFHIDDRIIGEECTHFSDVKSTFITIGKSLIQQHGESGFMFRASQIFLKTLNADGEEITDQEIYDHISCELIYDDKTYFRINQKWSFVDDSFKHSLKLNFEKVVSENSITDLFDVVYEGQDEGRYIDTLCKEKDTYKLHHLYPDGRHEFCDIIRVKEGKIYIVHVKVGTGVAIRELTQQVDLSAIRFRETRASIEQTYFSEIYRSLKKSGGTKDLTENQFIDMLRIGEVSFVAMICALENGNPLVDVIDSCIAQYSIVNMVYHKNEYGYPVYIYSMIH